MARVFPFRPYRYSPQAGPLDCLVTQPYDKITPEMRRRYLGLSPHNLVRVILGERLPSDSPGDNVYTRAAAHLENWISRGILQQDSEPGLFPYFQEFEVPDSGERVVRKGFIGLGAVEDYSQGAVHRHEQTLSGPKQDRLELLRHTHAHFGQIFMLYPDPAGEVDRALDEAARSEPIADVCDEYAARHRVWRLGAVERVQELMAAKPLIIADGHHRYETALAFRSENPEAGKVMMTFVNLHSPGLRILATHRVVRGLEGFDANAFLRRAREVFTVKPLSGLGDLRHALQTPPPDTVRIGAALSGALYLLEAPREAGALDVPVLHRAVLDNLLGIRESAVRDESHLRYVRGLEEAVRADAQVAFLLAPTRIEDVARVALSGGVMPQKSTDFYPKLLSGLTIYRLEKGTA